MRLQSPRLSVHQRLQRAAEAAHLALGPGEQGDAVRALQQALHDLGYDMSGSFRNGAPDGVLGPKTSEALRRFQKDLGLHADGLGGPITLMRLDGVLVQRGIAEEAPGARSGPERSVPPPVAARKTNRQLLVEEAAKHLGSHYLWGTAGARPNEPDGPARAFKTPKLEPCCLDYKDPSVGVAYMTNPLFKVCRGRWKKLPGGRTASYMDFDLRQYLDAQRGCAVPQPFLSRFTPRAAVDLARDGRAVRPNYPGLLWGEDCRGVRHFDCIGYICYCIGQVLKVPEYLLDLSQMRAKANLISGQPASFRPEPGDILFRGTVHIAIMGDGNKILQAEGEDTGVHDQEFYAPGLWDRFLRDNW